MLTLLNSNPVQWGLALTNSLQFVPDAAGLVEFFGNHPVMLQINQDQSVLFLYVAIIMAIQRREKGDLKKGFLL